MTQKRYHLAARILHWLMAAGLAFMWACGFTMTTLVQDDSPTEELLYALHISVGVTLLALLSVRLGVRIAYRPPPLPIVLTPIERDGARVGHVTLYVLPLIVIALGWAETAFGGHGVEWFGLGLPALFPEWETGEETAETLHRWLAYATLAVASGHAAFAVKHRLEGRDVLYRMGFGRTN